VKALAIVPVILVASTSHADLRRTVTAMSDADGEVCGLLRAETTDTCKRVAKLDANVAAYQSGSARGIRRVVLVVRDGDRQLVGPGIDLLGDGAKLTVEPTLRPILIDGKPGVVLDVIAKFKLGKDAWTTEEVVGCAQTETAWKCAMVDVGRCNATVADNGTVTSSCGDSTTLSLGTVST
jgi:hypothetical protein